MTLRSQLYLLQLEDYDLSRFRAWTRNNPGREVVEKKGKIRWSWKAKCLYFLGGIVGIEKAMQLLKPLDDLIKSAVIGLAFVKIRLIHSGVTTVAVTGSWGKTTTKEKLAEILKTKFGPQGVYKTHLNHNTDIGVAIEIFKMPLSTEVFVCEMGAFKQGDIKRICQLVKPKVGIITAIGPMHLERFGSLETIERTKREVHHNIPSDGLKIDPGEDVVEKVSQFFKLDPQKVSETLANFKGAKNRLEVSISNGITIIDDSYNSNPVGFEMALKKLSENSGSPKILVTPGMIEMGNLQFENNKKAAEIAKKIVDVTIFVGETNKKAWQTGLNSNVHFVKDMDEAKIILAGVAKSGSVVLFENDLPDQYF